MAEPAADNSLHEFIDFLFGGLTGVAYVAVKDPTPYIDKEGKERYNWTQHYYDYPQESDRLESVIHQSKSANDVYIAPALYKIRDYQEKNFKVSNVLWTEFDGNAPSTDVYSYHPSYRIKSSDGANEHVYWKLTEPISDRLKLQELNRAICYSLGADNSAWDATQILRPPDTFNHKYDPPQRVNLLEQQSLVYDIEVFETVPKGPDPIDPESWEPSLIPDVTAVILKYAFNKQQAELIHRNYGPHNKFDRSEALMQLAHFGCEMGMSNPEIFAILLNADERWKKFAGRKDQNKRLAHIITVARHRHPEVNDTHPDEEQFALLLDFVSFMNTTIEIDWVVENMLMEQGSMLMVGPSGVGKTTFSTRFAINLALGKPYLDYQVTKPRKMLFLSLEMGHGELQYQIKPMLNTLEGSELDLLRSNMFIVPHGEKWALNKQHGQEQLLRIMDAVEPDGILIDSVGSSLQGSINNDEHVQDLVDFYDRLRKATGCFVWNIHHMRKSANGGHAPTGQDDVYGNQYLFNRSTSCYGMFWSKDESLRIKNLKQRLAEREKDYWIKRTEYNNFAKVPKVIASTEKKSVTKKEKEEPEQNGNFLM